MVALALALCSRSHCNNKQFLESEPLLCLRASPILQDINDRRHLLRIWRNSDDGQPLDPTCECGAC